jgi:hypothetical protein
MQLVGNQEGLPGIVRRTKPGSFFYCVMLGWNTIGLSAMKTT